MASEKEFEQLFQHHESGRLSRRDLLKHLGAAGLAAPAIRTLLALSPLAATEARAAMEGAEQRAWKLAQEAAKKAEKKTLTIVIPTGSIGNMTPYVDKWKKELGIDTEFIEFPDDVVHSKAMQEAVAKTGRYDVIMGTPMSYPDWAEAGLIHDLTPWVEKFDPEIHHPEHGCVAPQAYLAQYYKGKVYALWEDGDQWQLMMRNDYLTDAKEKSAFKAKYGRELAAPNTWAEYDQMVEFFNRPDKKFYGGLEYRSRYYVKWAFMQRFVSKGKLYFDEKMEAQFDSPEGIATLKELMAISKFMHPDAFNFTWSSNYNAYGRGEGFSNFAWPSGFKYAKNPKTGPATAGKVVACPVPGQPRADGTLLRAAMFPFGWGFTVSKYSEIPELAYAYIQWMTSPTISADAIPYLGGYSDPYRKSHMLAPTPKLLATYSKEFLESSYKNIVNTIPDFCLRGGFEYQDALDKELHAAVTGAKSAEQALKDANKAINRITKRIGVPEQLAGWKFLVANMSEPIKRAAGAEKWAVA
jgi:multiple sugar transport system substrate-binding protein